MKRLTRDISSTLPEKPADKAAAVRIDLGAITPFFYCFREREAMLDILEAISGGRMMFNFFRVGGVRDDIPAGWADQVAKFSFYNTVVFVSIVDHAFADFDIFVERFMAGIDHQPLRQAGLEP